VQLHIRRDYTTRPSLWQIFDDFLPPVIRAKALARITGKSQPESLIYPCRQTVVKCHRRMSKALSHKQCWDGTGVRKDVVKKPSRRIFLSQRISVPRISRTGMRCGFAAGLTIIVILTGILTPPAPGSAAEPLNEPVAAPSPTPIQVTPPPRGTSTSSQPSPGTSEAQDDAASLWTQIWSGLQPFAGGVRIWIVALITLLVLAALLALYVRRRRHATSGPSQVSSVPLLKSADGGLYFRLDRLNEDGLIIGRGKGVDLRIKETTPSADTVSGQHARIYYDARYGSVIIEDLDSTNGVFINGRQAPRKNLLKDGWVVSLGSVTLTYHDGESDTGPLD
jgi:hypothetical protein